MNYPTELVLKVNEVYHDVEESEYTDKHPEIFKYQVTRWQRVAQHFIKPRPQPVTLLDIGSGTGFVPLQVGQFLTAPDKLICSDISANMLQVCQANLAGQLPCQLEYLKLTGHEIALPDESLYYITMNSVLHHIPNLELFLQEIARLLQKGGYLLIAHEPHKPFYENQLLWLNYQLVLNLTHPRRLGGRLARQLGAKRLVARLSRNTAAKGQNHDALVTQINDMLLQEQLINTPLTYTQIAEIVDIHSPTAGRGHKERGLNLENLLRQHLPDFKIAHFETYRHLAKVTYQNRWTIAYDKLLARLWPQTGSTFFAVLQKEK